MELRTNVLTKYKMLRMRILGEYVKGPVVSFWRRTVVHGAKELV